ncbi:MAG: hypothetical protein K2M47_05225 [Clostridiales bacterium]|nr:hypothetical protein [Clostridiales bacterium]
MQLNVNTLCANEFALAIALTVFVLITVIFAVLLISLAASKNFRTVFFREKSHKKKSTKKPAVSEPAPTMPEGGVDTIPIDPPKPRRTPTRKSATENTPDFLNAIPTVPLGGFPQGPAPTRGGKARSSSARNTEIPNSREQGGTYTTRSITITRARPSTPKQAQSGDETDAAENKPARTPKKR